MRQGKCACSSSYIFPTCEILGCELEVFIFWLSNERSGWGQCGPGAQTLGHGDQLTVYVTVRRWLVSKADHCWVGRKIGIPRSKKWFTKEKSFLQESPRNPSCSPPSTTFKIHMAPRRIFLLCQPATYLWGCSRAILISGQGYFTFSCLSKEAGVGALDQAWQWLEAASGTHHHTLWFWTIIFLVERVVEASCPVQTLSWCLEHGVEGSAEFIVPMWNATYVCREV